MKSSAFTMVELLITVFVAILVIGGIMILFINSIALDEYSQELATAMNIARAKLEENIVIQHSGFDSILETSGTLSSLTDGINGLYHVGVTGIDTDLKNVQVSVCWRSRGGKIIGDCMDTNGTLQWGASYNSPCHLETAIARR